MAGLLPVLFGKLSMSSAEKLCVVDDVLFIKGRGLVISTSIWRGVTVKVNDWVELRSVDGTSNFAKIKSIDMVRCPPNEERAASAGRRYTFTLAQIHRDGVKQGNEVWSVVGLPTEVSQMR